MPFPWEIENFLDVRNGQLHIDGVSAVELARSTARRFSFSAKIEFVTTSIVLKRFAT